MRLDYTSCYSCPSHFIYGDAVPQKRNGVMMHLGDRFCLLKKKAIRLKARDLKNGCRIAARSASHRPN